MSDRAGRADRTGETRRAQLPLLDRLIDDAPDQAGDPAQSSTDAMEALRRSVRRDLESLLNTRRRWRSWPATLRHLERSPIGYGIPDFTSGAFADPRRREALRLEIERAIRRFETRFLSVRVALIDSGNPLDSTLRLRIEALMHAHPAPEPIAFDTMVDAATSEVSVQPTAAS